MKIVGGYGVTARPNPITEGVNEVTVIERQTRKVLRVDATVFLLEHMWRQWARQIKAEEGRSARKVGHGGKRKREPRKERAFAHLDK